MDIKVYNIQLHMEQQAVVATEIFAICKILGISILNLRRWEINK